LHLGVDSYLNLIDNHYQQDEAYFLWRKSSFVSRPWNNVWRTLTAMETCYKPQRPLLFMTCFRPTHLLATLLISVTVDMKLKKPLRAFFMSVI